MAIAQVVEVSVGIVARHVTDSQADTSHEFIDMIQAECPPGIALAGLYHRFGILQGSLEDTRLKAAEVFLVTVSSAHIIQVDTRYFGFVFPTVAAFHHRGDTCSVHAVGSTEHPLRGVFAGFFRRETFIQQDTFGIVAAFGYVVVFTVTGCGGHIDGFLYQGQAGRSDVAQLAGSLYDNIHAGTPQVFRIDQADIQYAVELVADRFYP